MSTTFPTSLQDLDASRGTTGQPLSTPNHITHHTTEDDTVEALQAKVGVDNSADATSIDYLLKSASSTSPGHKHVQSEITDLSTGGIPSDGSDGDVTISSGTTTLTKDMFYNNLTVNGTGILATAGFRVMVKGTLTVDGTSGAKIQHNGGNGGNASGATGGLAGAAAVAGTLPVGIAGVAGANGRGDLGGGAAGTVGVNGAYAITTTQGSTGGTGGAGASQPGGAGGAGGTNTGTITGIPRTIFPAFFGWETNGTALRAFGIANGAGSGGAGGGQGGATSGGGGGSGASGGYVYVQAKIMSLTGAGCIRANGGNGGNGGNATSNAGGGGGGAGGSGGVVILVYTQKTGTGTALASGGTKGTYGTGYTNPVVLASDGVAGTVIEMY